MPKLPQQQALADQIPHQWLTHAQTTLLLVLPSGSQLIRMLTTTEPARTVFVSALMKV